MLAIQNRQYLSVIATTGADIHCAVTYRDSGLGRGRTRTKLTSLTASSASPGTAILGSATAGVAPDSAQASFEVVNVSIRNIDSTSQTVTVCIVETDDSGTQTVYQLYKETLAAGNELVYEEGAAWALAAHSAIGLTNRMIAPADVINSTTTPADVTGLTFAVLSGKNYRFRAVIPYSAAATTTGSRFMTNGPAITKLNGMSVYTVDATTQTVNFFTAHGVPAAANASSLATGNVAIVEGEFTPSADGTLAIQFASEVGASAITALAGATLEVVQLS